MGRVLAIILTLLFAGPAQADLLVTLFGDSRTAGSVGPPWWPDLLKSAPYLIGAKVSDFSLGNMTLAKLNAQYHRTGHVTRPREEDVGIAFIYGGINDLSRDTEMSGDDIYTVLSDLVAKARADHYRIVLITETCGASLSDERAQACDAFNRSIISGPKIWDVLVRADIEFADHADRDVYLDGVHFAANGQSRLGAAIARELSASDIPREIARPE